MRPLKIVSAILGIVFALAGIALVTSAGFVLGVYGNERDASGFFTSPSRQVGSYGFALTAPDINAQLGSRWEKWVPTRAQATVRITGASELPGPLFIGVAPTNRVSKYLSGVARDRIKSIDLTAGSVKYDHVDGTSRPGSPGRQDFWVAKAEGTGTQTLDWDLKEGDWTVVVMNAEATPPVAATMSVGAHFGIINWIVLALTGGGVVALTVGGMLIALGTRRRRRRPSPQRAYGPAVLRTPAPSEPFEWTSATEFPDAPQPPRPPARPSQPGRAERPSRPGPWDI